MSYLKIVADDKTCSIEASGNPVELIGTLGAATVQALERIIPDVPCPPGKTIETFCSVLDQHLRKALGVDSGKEKPQEEERREHVCRCQKKADEASSGEHVCRCREESEKDRKLTLEEIAEMIGKLNDEERNRWGYLIIQRAVDYLAALAADEKPKESDKKGSGPVWTFDLGTLT